MKKNLILLSLLILMGTSYSQNVGIGTTTPVARLHVADSNVLFSTTAPPPITPGNPPQSGSGGRMMWYADKVAFRAGYTFNNWDKDSIGVYSFATGFNTKAKGNYSTSFGNLAFAEAEGAFSAGLFTRSTGNYAASFGNSSQAIGYLSFASGDSSIAKAWNGVAFGSFNDISDNPIFYQSAITDRIFQVGNGTAGNRSNVLTVLRNGKTGIGTITPFARLHVADSSVLFSGLNQWQVPLVPGNPPSSGAGIRTMWYPDKAAFRSGAVSGTQWDKDNIGNYSMALGFNNRAIGEGSFAAGAECSAIGDYSIALGNLSHASGVTSVALGQSAFAEANYSVAIGYATNIIPFAAFSTAIGIESSVVAPYSTAIGYKANAIGNFSFAAGYTSYATYGATAIGYETNAAGFYSTAMGDSTLAAGTSSIAFGHKARAYADFSIAFGNNTKAKGTNSFVVGAFNDTTATNRIFEIGKGTADNLRSNAMTVLTNGNVGIGDNNPVTKLSVAGNGLVNGSFTVGSLSGFPHTLDVFGNAQFRGSNYLSIINSSGTEDTYIRGGKFSSKVYINDIANMGPVITASNVGIGNTNPLRPLSFPASLGEKILLYPGGSGEVGIGVYGNELRLHCDNPGSIVSFGTQDNAGVFTQAGRFQLTGGYGLFVNGNIWANGTTYASDERFKQNITPISSPLQKLLLINGVEYEMKAKEFGKNNFQPERQIGLLAQNVEKIIPEAVKEADGYKGVDYARLVPLLIEGIKEQQKKIEQLEKENIEIKKLISQNKE